MTKDFDKNVFINCPFDKEFEVLLRPLLFTIVYLGFNPRIAIENSDASINRLTRIIKLIKESRYSIHDLSRIKSGKKNEFARLNMPFELGIDFGSKEFSEVHRRKMFLILSEKDQEYKKALSDISGFDIKIHGNDPAKLVDQIRNWFYETVGITNAPPGITIWYEFLDDFQMNLITVRRGQGRKGDYELQTVEPVKEYIQLIKNWKENKKSPHSR